MNRPEHPSLADIRIIDLATADDAYCGKLLADLGADVIKVEPCNGDPARRLAPFRDASDNPGVSSFFRHYNANKRSIVLDPAVPEDQAIFDRLVAGADALIASGSPRELRERDLAPEGLLEKYPRLVVAAISPFGLTGPRCNWKSSDLVAQATGGLIYVNGRPDERPLRAWGPQSHHAASLHAAIGILLALLARDRTGKGQLVDVSLQESVTSMLEHVGAAFHATGEIQERRGTLHWTRTFRAGRCRDGYVLLSILGDWTSLIEWMKADGAGADFVDSVWDDVDYRREHCEPLFAELDRWATGYSVRELVEGAQARRLPFAPLLAVGALPRHEQLLARKFFVELGAEIHPGAPYRFSATPWRLRSPAPRCDEHRDEIMRELEGDDSPRSGWSNGDLPPTPLVRRGGSENPSRPAMGTIDVPPPYQGGGQGEVGILPRRPNPTGVGATTLHLPLHGIRILDFTWVVAGPLATRVLADQGADVIKIERPDAKGLDRRRGALAASLNRGKRSVILDMEEPRGVEIGRELVRHCDVVIDNFSNRVMTNWGMSYLELRRIKPNIIALGMSGFGRNGPYRDYVSYGPTLQAMAGFTWHMRRPGGNPTGWGFSYSDMVSGYSAAFAVLTALWHRSRTGEGQGIDLAQYETLLTFIGPELVAAANGAPVPPPSTPRGAPEGIYRCRDLERDGAKRDRWCALAVFSDEEWERCVRVFGNRKWAREPRFATLAGRRTHREELDAFVEGWTSPRSAEEVMDEMQAAGIAAGIVANAEDLCEHDPHLAARGYWQLIQTADGRTQTLDAITPRPSRTSGEAPSPAPQPGDHTEQVLREVLHMEQSAIDALRRERIIA